MTIFYGLYSLHYFTVKAYNHHHYHNNIISQPKSPKIQKDKQYKPKYKMYKTGNMKIILNKVIDIKRNKETEEEQDKEEEERK